MSRFIKNSEKMSKYVTKDIQALVTKHRPYKTIWKDAYDQGRMEIGTWYSEVRDKSKVRNFRYSLNARKNVTGIKYQKAVGRTIVGLDDYKKFIATKSVGLTKIGQKLLQQSVESYVYAVLGAQAKTRWSIVNSGAKSSQTQDVFREFVEDTIAQSDPTVTISNMRRSIHETYTLC